MEEFCSCVHLLSYEIVRERIALNNLATLGLCPGLPVGPIVAPTAVAGVGAPSRGPMPAHLQPTGRGMPMPMPGPGMVPPPGFMPGPGMMMPPPGMMPPGGPGMMGRGMMPPPGGFRGQRTCP